VCKVLSRIFCREENQVESCNNSLHHDHESLTQERLLNSQPVLHSTPNGDCDVLEVIPSVPGDEDSIEEQPEDSRDAVKLLYSIKETNDDVFTTDSPKPSRKLGIADAFPGGK